MVKKLPRVAKRISMGSMGQSRIRNAVLGIALSVGLGLLATNSSATVPTTEQIKNVTSSEVLLLIPAEGASVDNRLAWHYSHRSHYSHYSHRSHYSHYSHYSSYY